MSTIPGRYREVSVATVDVPLAAETLRALLTSRPVYRRTRYVVVRLGDDTALVEVHPTPTGALFHGVADITLLATPEETAYLRRPDVDTGVPSELVRAAQDAPGARCVVVEGRHGHVNFVLDPDPVRLHVVDVAPPRPAKLVDQVHRVLQTADDLPAILPVPHVIELSDLLPAEPIEHVLLQCRGGGMEVAGATVSYLDEVPPHADWTLLGCARSRAIHAALYDGDVPQIDTCPRALTRDTDVPLGEVRMVKCCLLEEHLETDGQTVVVPWGASYTQLREGLSIAAGLARPVLERS